MLRFQENKAKATQLVKESGLQDPELTQAIQAAWRYLSQHPFSTPQIAAKVGISTVSPAR